MKYLDDYDVLMSKRSQLDGLVFLRTLHPGPEGHTGRQQISKVDLWIVPDGWSVLFFRLPSPFTSREENQPFGFYLLSTVGSLQVETTVKKKERSL